MALLRGSVRLRHRLRPREHADVSVTVEWLPVGQRLEVECGLPPDRFRVVGLDGESLDYPNVQGACEGACYSGICYATRAIPLIWVERRRSCRVVLCDVRARLAHDLLTTTVIAYAAAHAVADAVRRPLPRGMDGGPDREVDEAFEVIRVG